jgi:hypothetical protein
MARPKGTTGTVAPTVDGTGPIAVRQRRIQVGQRNNVRVGDVRLVKQDEPMVTRWVNPEIDGRYFDVTEEKGWEDVVPADIAGGLPQGSMFEKDGKVVRADGAILVKMPATIYRQILRSREGKSDAQMKSSKHMRQAAANLASEHGMGAAADQVMGSGMEVLEHEIGKDRYEPGSTVRE